MEAGSSVRPQLRRACLTVAYPSRPGWSELPSPPSPSAPWCCRDHVDRQAPICSPANIYKEYFNPNCTDAQESRMAKDRFADRQGRRTDLHFRLSAELRDRAAVLGGIWIRPDAARRDSRTLYALVPPRRLVARAGRRGIGAGTWNWRGRCRSRARSMRCRSSEQACPVMRRYRRWR